MIPGFSSRFLVIGANHRSASLTLRDQLFIDDDQAPAFLDGLRRTGLVECLVLATCDRVEIWACHHDADAAARMVARAMAERSGLEAGALLTHFYRHEGQAALRHAFAVTASLDSLIIGEPHVLGQVKAAHHLARDGGTLGAGLDLVMQAAFAAAKRIRSETSIGEGPVSIAAAAIQVARDLHGDLKKCSGLLVGAGEMGELLAENLAAAGMTRITVTAPRQSRAEAVAQALGLHVAPFDQLPHHLAQADIIVAAVGARTHVLRSEHLVQALKARRRKPIFVVDAAIPGDVEPAVNRLDGAFLYDLSDLEQVAREGRATREQAARAAWAVLDQELAGFAKGRQERAAVPAITALRQHFEEVRGQVLAELGNDADAATRLLIHRLLHIPSEELKQQASQNSQFHLLEKALRTLFRLES